MDLGTPTCTSIQKEDFAELSRFELAVWKNCQQWNSQSSAPR